MWAAIGGFFTALPQLLSMIQSFMGWFKKISGDDPAGFAVRAGAVFNQLSAAQTEDDHAKAAQALADLVRSLPPR